MFLLILISFTVHLVLCLDLQSRELSNNIIFFLCSCTSCILKKFNINIDIINNLLRHFFIISLICKICLIYYNSHKDKLFKLFIHFLNICFRDCFPRNRYLKKTIFHQFHFVGLYKVDHKKLYCSLKHLIL